MVGSRTSVAAVNVDERVGRPAAGAGVRFDSVSCTFRHGSSEVRVLKEVSLEVAPGEFVCVVGRSGQGKTTLLRLLAGLESPTGGAVLVDGEPVVGPGSERGMVFQQDTVFPWMRVKDNVEFSLQVRGVPPAERRRQCDQWLSAVGLLEFASFWPRALSGGMRKRVAVAAMLASGADVWLMDEPFGSLDYFTRRTLHALVERLWNETAKTVFFVTHDIEEALILADRILVVSEGRIVEDLRVTLPRPRDEEVRASPEAVAVTKTVLGRLGIEEGR